MNRPGHVPQIDADDALYTAASVRALDHTAINDFGTPGIELMERAGAAAWREFTARWPTPARIAVACGPGNNGGDGFVVARLAAADGTPVDCYLLGDVARVRGDAATAMQRLLAAGGEVRAAGRFDPANYGAVVDGVFGTGLARALEGEAARFVAALDAVAGPRLALDVPSGLSADTGNVLGTALRADVTVTFIGLKRGLLTGDALDHCGEVVLDRLGVHDDVYLKVPPDGRRLNAARVGRPLGDRSRRAHKGRFGHVLVVGGDHGFPGAARLCAEAAARCGAGLTSVATRAEHVVALVTARPELMVRGVDGAPDLEPLLAGASVLALGPGLGGAPWGRALLERALATDLPRVLDADALNLLASHRDLKAQLARAPAVATPHPGEAARLLGVDTGEVERDRFAAAQALCGALGCTVVLKGAGTLVQAPGEIVSVIEGGNPGMASGGMGDVLTGVVAALLAQGLPAPLAAGAGAALHAAAGDLAAAGGGERGLLASDLFVHLRALASGL